MMDRDEEIETLADDIAACVNRWWNEHAENVNPSLREFLMENLADGNLDHLTLVRDAQDRILVPIKPVELSFMRRFDPERDRSASRRELVEVIEHWQAEITEGLGPL